MANVTLWGERLQMLQVQVRPDAMTRNISLNQVMETTAEAVDSGLLLYDEVRSSGPAASSRRRTSGSTCAPCCPSSRPTTWRRCRSRRCRRRLIRRRKKPEEGGAGRAGPIVRLGDVADVVEDHQPLLGDGAVNDGLGLMLIVEKRRGPTPSS